MSYNKYKNNKVTIDGIRFDSQKEAGRYLVLKQMQKNGEITNLELQPEFVLQEKFRFEGKAVRAIKYIADFRYKDKEGNVIIEDVKGMKTEVYKIKKKMLLNKIINENLQIQFREI